MQKNRTRLHILLAAARRHDQLSTIAACLARRCWAKNRCNEHNFLCANTNKPSKDHRQTRERARIKIACGGGCGFLFANLWAGAAPTLFSVRKMLKFWPPLVVARAALERREEKISQKATVLKGEAAMPLKGGEARNGFQHL